MPRSPWAGFFATVQCCCCGCNYFCISYVWYFLHHLAAEVHGGPGWSRHGHEGDLDPSILNGLPLFSEGSAALSAASSRRNSPPAMAASAWRGRSVGVLGLLASGVMIVVAVQVKSSGARDVLARRLGLFQ